ncbi:Sugar or nucleoside kinase, ribokinase family [Roseomonas rosea]|uniref:Sugar or nucleoside kinase, ribokinase family n=1 Tax=Muricoccus roseus TaxID=198092 RepID=A0A1M6MWW6_9PROT|nr:adenosine kinase [Roseomonas rosea]SHJ87975.1 Sugar or nucleoside kinase, ribokinase family [Roseomonas rosea]
MAERQALDILGIGNAIVDVVASATEATLRDWGMAKGGMALIDTARAEAIHAAVGEGVQTGGGSAANTCAAAASLGARVGYLGKVADDAPGRAFAEDLKALGIHFPTRPLKGGDPTARCLILVTPDGQRTMNTYLGACVAFEEADVDQAAVESAAVTYLEGYLFDPPAAQAAFRRAAAISHGAGRSVAITLSDSFCVGRHRTAFLDFIARDADIVFANEDEALSLFEVGDAEEATRAFAQTGKLVALTRSEKGSRIISPAGEVVEVPAVPTTLIDSTGAGDAYAAGFLAAHARGLPLAECGRWGSVAASEVISHFGARPQAELKALVGG